MVISGPDNIMTLQPMDNIIALVQYEDAEDKEKLDGEVNGLPWSWSCSSSALF